jgi:hypothetical protein
MNVKVYNGLLDKRIAEEMKAIPGVINTIVFEKEIHYNCASALVPGMDYYGIQERVLERLVALLGDDITEYTIHPHFKELIVAGGS